MTVTRGNSTLILIIIAVVLAAAGGFYGRGSVVIHWAEADTVYNNDECIMISPESGMTAAT